MLRASIVLLSLMSAGAAFASDPCTLATKAEVKHALGGSIVPIPTSEIGEETAPYCVWATKAMERMIKIEIWSDAELPVLDLPNASAYYEKLKADNANDNLLAIGDVGEAAFGASFTPGEPRSDGMIVVLKAKRVIVIWYTQINQVDAITFASKVASRLR